MELEKTRQQNQELMKSLAHLSESEFLAKIHEEMQYAPKDAIYGIRIDSATIFLQTDLSFAEPYSDDLQQSLNDECLNSLIDFLCELDCDLDSHGFHANFYNSQFEIDCSYWQIDDDDRAILRYLAFRFALWLDYCADEKDWWMPSEEN